ncbi:hypothetical protein N4264_16375 [Tahibacter amnicola]|uniref:Uncharacterized protein n=1 Tax=Tahibacter amnicola TaxID=2976241 RepID=A0ABY6B9U1_9GAMM|nr:hypothetical protein [Tahibacter amnicola]UXI66322.1 hypothetical protein N4264_16375 [Tahibacter amnicola]
MTLLYAIHIDKLPIILGSMFLPFVYARNLWLLMRHGSAEKPPQNEA